ncbi:MAG: DUF5686 family protein, partial [Bacteroidota bacterium]
DRRLFKKVLAAKKANNPARKPVPDQHRATRTSIFLSELDPSVRDRRVFRNSREAFLSVGDTSLLMPVFLSEDNRQFRAGQDSLLATQTDGIFPALESQVKTMVLDKVSADMNFYDNQLLVLDRSLPSPLSKRALMYYNVYLIDSAMVGETEHYQFEYYPKNPQHPTFRGTFWVESGSFALTRVEARLPNTANINFIRDLEMTVTYQPYTEGWYVAEQAVQMNMVLRKKKKAKKQKNNYAVRKSVVVTELGGTKGGVTDGNLAMQGNGGVGEALPYLQSKGNSTTADPDFDAKTREAIATLRDNSLVKTVDKVGATGLTGFFNLGPVDFGPIYDLYRRNQLEGHRIALPLRTSEKFSQHFSLGGYLAYGTTDRVFKYGGNLHVNLPTKRRTILSLRYYDDFFALSRNKYIEFVRENPFSQGDGNPISNFTEAPNNFLIRREELSLSLQHQLKNDIGLLVRPFAGRVQSNQFVPFQAPGTDATITEFRHYGVLLDARFSFGQPYDDGYFTRFYYGNGKPVIHLTTEVGQTTLGQTTSPYAHLQASIKQRFPLGPGSLRMLVDGGYIAGKVPFPMLHMPRGSRSLGLARYNYSLLNQAAFVSDLYTNAYLDLNGGGVLFSHVPLLKRLDIRESVSLKAHYGRLTGSHTDLLRLPNGLHRPLDQPYMEVGMGIANLFKFVRIEYVRRVNKGPVVDQVAAKHGVLLRMEVTFYVQKTRNTKMQIWVEAKGRL